MEIIHVNVLYPGQDLPNPEEIAADATVQELTDLVAPKVNIPKEQIRFIFLGKTLKPTDKLNEVGVEDGYAMHMVEHITAPPGPQSISTLPPQLANFRFNTFNPQNEENLPIQNEFRRLIVVLQQEIASQQADLLQMKMIINNPQNSQLYIQLREQIGQRIQKIQNLIKIISSFKISKHQNAVLIECQNDPPNSNLHLTPEQYNQILQDERQTIISRGRLYPQRGTSLYDQISEGD